MAGRLAKTPLTAVIFAALLCFVTAFLPVSEGYRAVLAEFTMPIAGYIMMIVYGLWASVILALLFSNTQARGMGLLLPAAVALLGCFCVQPVLELLFFGDPMGVLAQSDVLMRLIAYAVSTILLLALCAMLMKGEPADKAFVKSKVKFRMLPLIIKIIVSPLIFCILFVLAWYFLAWSSEAVRLYYTAGAGAPDDGFVRELVNMLFNNAGLLPFSLAQGLIFTVLSIPLLLLAYRKRMMFIVLNAMLYLSSALYWLIPLAGRPDGAAPRQLIRYAVLLVVYSVLVGFLLHTSLVPPEKEVESKGAKTAPAKAPAKAAARR